MVFLGFIDLELPLSVSLDFRDMKEGAGARVFSNVAADSIVFFRRRGIRLSLFIVFQM